GCDGSRVPALAELAQRPESVPQQTFGGGGVAGEQLDLTGVAPLRAQQDPPSELLHRRARRLRPSARLLEAPVQRLEIRLVELEDRCVDRVSLDLVPQLRAQPARLLDRSRSEHRRQAGGAAKPGALLAAGTL